jgi:internalin A
MRCLFPHAIRFVLPFVLSAGLTVGCQKKDAPPQGADNVGVGKPDPLDNPLAKEDPEVAGYLKKKGWPLIRDMRIADGKWVVLLSVEDRDKPFQDVTLTPDDYKMIARSKTVQLLDLRKVNNTDDGLKAVAGIPQLEGIIVKGDDVTDDGVKALARCPSLDQVSLITKKVTDAGVKELAALPKLQWLYLGFMTLSGSAFEAFAGSKKLQSVTLEYVDGLTDEGAKHLAKLPNLNELKIGRGFGEGKLTAAGIKAIVDARLPARFEFDKKLIDDDLLEALVRKGWLYGPTPPGAKDKRPATPEEVTEIVLDDSKVTDKGLRAVLNCTNARSLFLARTGVTDETFKKLSAFKKLEYLSLEKTKVTAAGLDAVSGLPIKHLAMQGCELSEEAFKAFGKMAALEELWLSDAKMQGQWLKHIATLPKLKDLNLMRADFDDAAVKYVTTLPNLQSLVLNETKLGDAGFQELLKLPNLRSLMVDGTQVSQAVYQKAKKDHPKLTLYFYRYDNK